MANKPGSCNPMQKGERRQKLHEEQNNHGESKKKTSYRTPVE
ncbi:clostri-philic family protein [Cellulosilyticum lentocellum]|uniref:Uncharacterized protein n=1 Tax=Cellulosilyticum lentocellum (strain ATCC 49066 / DSM 5427 / NCIMB 11756 / RHM5) TaxID=642492 RepID=F2JPV8_CELLD|nr:clostri-philic family protein [Cellulosilyticum lentocellum]ADZ84893.1 hypothetical protein Clole_3199 [Cellulosilyticum lentocellum DSM 5427]